MFFTGAGRLYDDVPRPFPNGARDTVERDRPRGGQPTSEGSRR